MSDRRVTPKWISMSEAARGWGVSRRHARRIVRSAAEEWKRPVSSHGKIRTVDFLAIPRGDSAAAPMIPEVEHLWEKLDALAEQQQRLMAILARVCKHVGVKA